MPAFISGFVAGDFVWFDLDRKEPMIEAVTRAEKLRWLNSIYAGLDFLPLDLLDRRGVTITNGAGINALTIAEYVVMLMLVHAKGYREVVRAQERHEWLTDSPGKIELAGSRALLLGLGAIGFPEEVGGTGDRLLDQIVVADYVRCVETLHPLSESIGVCEHISG